MSLQCEFCSGATADDAQGSLLVVAGDPVVLGQHAREVSEPLSYLSSSHVIFLISYNTKLKNFYKQ